MRKVWTPEDLIMALEGADGDAISGACKEKGLVQGHTRSLYVGTRPFMLYRAFHHTEAQLGPFLILWHGQGEMRPSLRALDTGGRCLMLGRLLSKENLEPSSNCSL